MNKFKAFILDLFFPNRCPVCRVFIEYDKFICEKCGEKLKLCKADDICPECGKQECICSENMHYDKAVSAFVYEDAARLGILSLKDGHKEFGYYLGNILADMIEKNKEISEADMIIPVPMSAERLRERGYNQAEIIAEIISDRLGIEINNKILYKKASEVQHSLNREQRMKNVSAFGINQTELSGKKIILCDDVLTTGSTLNRCAELLKNAGAADVYAAAGATTKLKKEG